MAAGIGFLAGSASPWRSPGDKGLESVFFRLLAHFKRFFAECESVTYIFGANWLVIECRRSQTEMNQ
jgi:hypothetical protein